VNFRARQLSFRYDGAAECLISWSAEKYLPYMFIKTSSKMTKWDMSKFFASQNMHLFIFDPPTPQHLLVLKKIAKTSTLVGFYHKW
jgi:hypothetical protein